MAWEEETRALEPCYAVHSFTFNYEGELQRRYRTLGAVGRTTRKAHGISMQRFHGGCRHTGGVRHPVWQSRFDTACDEPCATVSKNSPLFLLTILDFILKVIMLCFRFMIGC